MARCSTRCGSPRCTTGTSRTAPRSRTSASGNGRGTTRAPGEDMEAAVARECLAARTERRDDGRLDPRQDRRAGPGRGRVPRPALHQPDEHAEGRLGPLRRDVRPRRHGLRRRHRGSVWPRTASWSPPRPATPPPCSTGWRSGCRPSGRSCGSRAPRSPSSGPPSRWSAPARVRVLARARGPGRRPTLPFMTWRDTDRRAPGPGLPDQLLRRTRLRGQRRPLVRVRALGGADRGRRRYGITPYGTETMHVLRAEKGYPIIGQDTDGTVTPERSRARAGRCREEARRTSSDVGRCPGQTRCVPTASTWSGCCRSTQRCCSSRARTCWKAPRSAAAAGAVPRTRHV